MLVREVRPDEREDYNRTVTHPLQSWEWGEFRESTGVEVVRIGCFREESLVAGYQITFHTLPKVPFTVGYMPKSILPSPDVLNALKEIGAQKKALFIKFEPNVFHPAAQSSSEFSNLEQLYLASDCVRGRPLFTKYSFVLDLTLSDEELFKRMHPKTRYNLRLSQKKGVVVTEDNSDEAFKEYLRLTFETTKRQGFYAHNQEYHTRMWTIMRASNIAHLLKASFEGETLVTWIVFIFNGILYYPYGASSSKHRNVMASNLMMWEAIRFGKTHHCKSFDLWGSLGPQPDAHDPWIGFHRFKEGYGPTLMEFVGSFDYVLDLPKYQIYTAADNLRWKWLKFRARLPF